MISPTLLYEKGGAAAFLIRVCAQSLKKPVRLDAGNLQGATVADDIGVLERRDA